MAIHPGGIWNILVRIFFFGICLFGFWTLSLPLYADLAAALGLLPLFLLSEKKHLLILSVSFTLGLALLQAVSLRIDTSILKTYRDHEMFDTGHDRYQANVSAVIRQPFGDMAAIDPTTPLGMREPRIVHFKTDSFGFRNSRDYAGEPVVLVGDSFIACNGIDQPQMFSEVLKRHYGIPAYNLAFPGHPNLYTEFSGWFLANVNPDARFAFFYYEGNDFEGSVPGRLANKLILPPYLNTVWVAYEGSREQFLKAHTPFLSYPGLLGPMARRIERLFFYRTEEPAVLVWPIGRKPVGFCAVYMRVAMDPKPYLPLRQPESIMDRTACVFFIPEKSRIYKTYLPPDIRKRFAEPPPGLLLLKEKMAPFGIPVIDLTPALRARARYLAPKGRYVFWRDDTHWNPEGIRTVAPVVARALARFRSH